jgi:23S rRNA pseudouridine2605 synthase
MKERLQKILAQAGIASRRGSEILVREGRVTVNGQVITQLGTKADPETDTIAVDGHVIAVPTKYTYIMLHKPSGYVTTMHDPQGRPTVLDLLPKTLPRVFPVGRLDLDTEGLLILTNNGEFAQHVLHPRYMTEKEYLVQVMGQPSKHALEALQHGVEIDGTVTAPARVTVVSTTRERTRTTAWLRVVLHEGRKRQVRRMCEAVGLVIIRLIRTRVGTLRLGDLPTGAYRHLTATEVRSLVPSVALLEDKEGKKEHRMKRGLTVAIDGPSAVGKSVVGKAVADKMGYRFLDTGAMYRAITWLALERGIDLRDETALGKLAREAQVEIGPPTRHDGRAYSVCIDGKDITWDIRSPEVDQNVSQVSMLAPVRDALVARQREMASRGQIVMVGRDIGTVVLPEADLKVFLTAAPAERARRRFRELMERGQKADYGEILSSIEARDRLDSGRAISPLKPAPDAIVIDTTTLTIEEVVQAILRQVV